MDPRGRTLVVYVFHEYNTRVRYFLDHALFEAADVDFVLVANDRTVWFNHVPSHVTTIVRDNLGYDFGAWSDVLLKHGYADRGYEHYIFVNSSVVGPFSNRDRWTDAFVRGLTGDVRLFGVTINCADLTDRVDPRNHAHVQSYLFAMNRDTMRDLVADGLFSTDYVDTFEAAIRDKEIRMSRLVLARGGNLGCMHAHYRGVDWRFRDRPPHAYPVRWLNDVMYPSYKGSLWTPEELCFIKGNRVPVRMNDPPPPTTSVCVTC